jgi:hypothetical protein
MLIGAMMAATYTQFAARLGWSEGRGFHLDVRWTTDNMDRVRAEAASLIQMRPDVIACAGDRVVAVFRELTNSIPIAMSSNVRGRIGACTAPLQGTGRPARLKRGKGPWHMPLSGAFAQASPRRLTRPISAVHNFRA